MHEVLNLSLFGKKEYNSLPEESLRSYTNTNQVSYSTCYKFASFFKRQRYIGKCWPEGWVERRNSNLPMFSVEGFPTFHTGMIPEKAMEFCLLFQ